MDTEPSGRVMSEAVTEYSVHVRTQKNLEKNLSKKMALFIGSDEVVMVVFFLNEGKL